MFLSINTDETIKADDLNTEIKSTVQTRAKIVTNDLSSGHVEK